MVSGAACTLHGAPCPAERVHQRGLGQEKVATERSGPLDLGDCRKCLTGPLAYRYTADIYRITTYSAPAHAAGVSEPGRKRSGGLGEGQERASLVPYQ